MDVNDLRITDGGSSDQHPKKKDRFSNFTKSSRSTGFAGWLVLLDIPIPKGRRATRGAMKGAAKIRPASPARLPGMLEMGRLPPEFTAISNNSDWENE